MHAANPRKGYILGLSAYVIWGLFPLYFKAIASVPAAEIIVHRVLWSALFGGLLLMVWKHPGWFRELRDNPKRLAILALSGSLIAGNWLTYVWSVNSGRMLEASLGYYINPLVNVLLGMLLLGERLRRLQWVAVGLAAVGVAQQVWQVGSLPWVSLVLALTFGFYGLIRKQAPVKALPGLVVETWMLVPIAVAWLLFNPTAHSAQLDVLEHLRSLVAGGRRPGNADPAGMLQRRRTAFALHRAGLFAVRGADPGVARSRAAVRRTPGAEHVDWPSPLSGPGWWSTAWTPG